MEYRFNDERNKKILVLLIILVILLAVIGALFFISTNDRVNVILRMDKAVDYSLGLLDNIKEFENKNIVEDTKFEITTGDTSQDEYNNKINGNAHLNMCKENEYNLILETSMNQDFIGGLYGKDGYIYLKFGDSTYQVNEEKFDDINNINISDIQRICTIVYNTMKNQLKEIDFYRIKTEDTKQVKFGLSLTDKRIQEILINTVDALKEDEEFIELYAKINNIESKEVIDKLDAFVKNLETVETNENNVNKLEIFTSGLLNTNTDKVILSRKESGIVKFTTTIMVENNNANIEIESEKFKYVINFANNNGNYGFDISNGDFNINGQIIENDISLSITNSIFKLYLENELTNKDNSIEKNGKISISISDQVYNIKYNSILSFETKKESVNLGETKNINELLMSLMLLTSFVN